MKLKTDKEIVEVFKDYHFSVFGFYPDMNQEDIELFVLFRNGYSQAQSDLTEKAVEGFEEWWRGQNLLYPNLYSDAWQASQLSHSKKDQEKDALIMDNLIKAKSVIDYCYEHLDKMWASRITGILLGCDFRDAKSNADEFFKYCEDKGI